MNELQETKDKLRSEAIFVSDVVEAHLGQAGVKISVHMICINLKFICTAIKLPRKKDQADILIAKLQSEEIKKMFGGGLLGEPQTNVEDGLFWFSFSR